jgi:hypothetical protein
MTFVFQNGSKNPKNKITLQILIIEAATDDDISLDALHILMSCSPVELKPKPSASSSDPSESLE